MKKIVSILLMVSLLSMILTGCMVSQKVGIQKDNVTPDEINTETVDSNNGFALNIFKQLNEEDMKNNVFISPFSISTALAMTYNGAETTTKEAMSSVLGFGDLDRSTVNENYKNLLNYLGNVDKKVELNIANSIWIKEGVHIKDEFLNTNTNNFNAKVTELDFSKDSSVTTINSWISDTTKGKIEKMLTQPIDPMVVMYLINAIYFKGQWSDEFDPKRTSEGTFTAYDGKKQVVPMMNRNGSVQYKKGEDYKAVRLPYGDGKVSMYLVLPDKDINSFIKKFDQDRWEGIRNGVASVEDVQLQIPKFKLEYGIKQLNESLKALGMAEAFSDRADFSGINDNVSISSVMHKAVIEVDEKGSEAAAVTVVEIKTTSAIMDPITFIANKPFMFIIADDTTGTILFIGKLLNQGDGSPG